MMNQKEFADTIRKKFPNGVASDGVAYSQMSDEDLTNRVVKKYPVYKSQVKVDSQDQGIGENIKNRVGDFVSGIKNVAAEKSKNIGTELGEFYTGKQDYQRTKLRLMGEGARAITDTGFEVVKLLTPKFIKDIASKGMQKISDDVVVQTLTQKYDELKQKHPEAMKDIEDVLDIASLIPMGEGAKAVAKTAEKTAELGGEAINKVSKITGETLEANRVARIAKAKDEVENVVGKIVQGNKNDIVKAKNALSTIDTTGVKTYGELKSKIDDGIEALAGKVDDKLNEAGKQIGVLKPKDFTTITKVGETSVKQNFVQDALKQLDELYTNIKDAPNRARIKNLQTRFSKEGLSLKEANDISREYGREFGNKAFSKINGEALTSVNAQAYENTRKGIKNIVRSKMPDDVTKMLDERMSEMYNTNRLVGKMEERVNTLYQKAQKRGLLENVARNIATVADAATFGTVSGFISRMLPSNVGLKIMNSIDLENELRKNLIKLDKLLKTTNDKALTDGISNLLKEGVH